MGDTSNPALPDAAQANSPTPENSLEALMLGKFNFPGVDANDLTRAIIEKFEQNGLYRMDLEDLFAFIPRDHEDLVESLKIVEQMYADFEQEAIAWDSSHPWDRLNDWEKPARQTMQRIWRGAFLEDIPDFEIVEQHRTSAIDSNRTTGEHTLFTFDYEDGDFSGLDLRKKLEVINFFRDKIRHRLKQIGVNRIADTFNSPGHINTLVLVIERIKAGDTSGLDPEIASDPYWMDEMLQALERQLVDLREQQLEMILFSQNPDFKIDLDENTTQVEAANVQMGAFLERVRASGGKTNFSFASYDTMEIYDFGDKARIQVYNTNPRRSWSLVELEASNPLIAEARTMVAFYATYQKLLKRKEQLGRELGILKKIDRTEMPTKQTAVEIVHSSEGRGNIIVAEELIDSQSGNHGISVEVSQGRGLDYYSLNIALDPDYVQTDTPIQIMRANAMRYSGKEVEYYPYAMIDPIRDSGVYIYNGSKVEIQLGKILNGQANRYILKLNTVKGPIYLSVITHEVNNPNRIYDSERIMTVIFNPDSMNELIGICENVMYGAGRMNQSIVELRLIQELKAKYGNQYLTRLRLLYHLGYLDLESQDSLFNELLQKMKDLVQLDQINQLQSSISHTEAGVQKVDYGEAGHSFREVQIQPDDPVSVANRQRKEKELEALEEKRRQFESLLNGLGAYIYRDYEIRGDSKTPYSQNYDINSFESLMKFLDKLQFKNEQELIEQLFFLLTNRERKTLKISRKYGPAFAKKLKFESARKLFEWISDIDIVRWRDKEFGEFKKRYTGVLDLIAELKLAYESMVTASGVVKTKNALTSQGGTAQVTTLSDLMGGTNNELGDNDDNGLDAVTLMDIPRPGVDKAKNG